MRRVLVLDARAILGALAHNKIDPDQLEDAIFFLSGWLEDGGDLNVSIPSDRPSYTKKAEAHSQLMTAIGRAERQGRLAWCGEPSWEQLNELLQRNGLPAITPVDGDEPSYGRYAHPLVEEAVGKQRLPYWVVWV